MEIDKGLSDAAFEYANELVGSYSAYFAWKEEMRELLLIPVYNYFLLNVIWKREYRHMWE